MSDDCELLFFDTFSHDSCEELNLDLVQFPRPVYIFEIRVIPLGARVQADFPGGHRLGATNPSSFQLEFFVNDLSKRSASTFERLGSMEYKQNVDIQFPVPNKIPTDGLVLRGWYSAVTLAVYGVLTKVTKERSSPPPPPPPQATGRQPSQEHCPVKDFGSPVTDTQIPEWERQARIPEVPPEPPPPPVRTHQQVVEAPRFVEVPPIIHQPPEPHVTYSTEIPPPVIGGFSEPPPPIVYQECVPVPQVAPAPTPYGQYEPHYSKPWPPPPEEQYQQPTETYDHQMYNRQQDQPMYQPPPDPGHSMWDPNKDRHGPEGHEHEGYGRPALLEHPSMHREKDMSKDRNRDRPWERDMHDYKDDDGRREHEKRKDRDRRSREASWERSSVDSDRYRDRDRDRMRDSVSRDRDRDRDRNRDRGFIDRGVRKDMREGKRPTTPPSPRKMRPHTPQTPPEVEKIISGPRTPKEEPIDMYDERLEGEGEIQEEEITEEDDGYEEIVSEEEDMSDVDDRAMDIIGDIDFDINDETWNFMTSFSPYTCELTTFQHFSDPMLFTYEITQIKNEKIKAKSILEEKAAEADKIFESLNEVHRQEHTEKWVETLESVNETTLSSLTTLKSQEKFNESIELLIAWAIEGLDFELALKQPQTAYKVRHLKAGIHLTTLLFQTNSDIIQKLLDKDIPKCLLQLYNQPYMVLPVKLLILRGIDAVLSTKAGLDYVVNKTVLFSPPKVFDFNLNWEEVKNEDLTEECMTCYQKLLDILSSKQLTRAVVSLSAIMNKIHLYEVLLELSDCVDKLVQSTQLPEPKPAASESPDTPEARASSIDPEIESDIASSSCDSLAQIIISCLQEIMSSYQNAGIQMAQAKRFLPARSQFEFPKSSNPYPSLLRIFRENKLLENIFVILSSPSLSGHPVMLTVLKDLFKEFMISQEGMLFLLSAPDVVNGINRALLHTADETREEATEENITQNLGMHIAYHLQALLYVDCLMACHAKESPKKDIDDADAVSALQNMYTMIFSPVGRPAVIDVLTMSENLNCLLPFVQVTGDEVLDTKKSKSVCAGYVTELLMLVVHYSEDVTMLEKFSDALFNLAQQEITPKLHDLGMWMSPTRSIQSYTHEAVGPLMSVLKSHIENAATLPPELITSLRILQHLTLPKNSNGENEELKYMYAIIQVFTNDGMEGLKGILQNVTDTYLKPSHQSPALVGLQGVLIVAVIKPAVFILKSILAYLISSRGTEFKDLTTVPVLLKVYSLMILVPPSSFSYQMAQAVQSEVIEALLTYTQPFLGTAESEEALSKSLWTEMVQEILKYVKLSPSTFVTGLTVLSELLPLPLPLQTRDPLCEDEITKMINYRKLWSAHLHSLSSTIQEVIVSLAATSCHPLQQLLRRVCVQLADLAAPTALFIVKAVLDALLEALMLPPPEQKENLDPSVPPIHDFTPVLKTPTSSTARILNLVSYLVSHASFKIPMIHVMRGSVKSDEKYLDVLPLMLELFNTPSDKPYVIQSHECIVSILQSLCDPDIGFITFESGASVNDVLSSSLPCKEQISQICGALVQHIGCHQHSYSSVLPSLRSLVMLTEHDYGYYHVKHGLDQHPGAVFSLFTRFSLSFSKDSSDCLSTLSTTLEFLRLMVNGYDDGGTTGRSILLPTSELAELLREDPAKGDKDKNKSSEPFQPVVELAKLLTEFGNDEEAVESLLESISGLLSLLNSAPTKTVKLEKEIVEPTLASPESQSAQFASRPVFMVGEVEEGRLSPAYWLSLLGADDTDQEQEQVPVDLIAIAEKNISGEFDLKSTLENLCLSADGEMDLNSKNKNITCIGGKRKYQPLINPALVDVNNKRPFIAPMRGRGFTRGNSHSSRANDPFRSRPPNTSRPPSMHVDDFVALESHHGGSSQPQNKRPVKEGGGRGRGRGGFERSSAFTSTRGTGGRFFSPPGPYGRRESNRGNRGTSRLSNNAWNNRSNPNSGQKLSPGPGQRTGFGGHRCDYNSPFNPSDTRPSGQRNRDSYTDLGRPSNVISLNRFPRGLRAGGMNQGNQGHWQDRGKGQNQRFITPGAPSRGSGRRDMNARHNRSFTR